MIAPKPKQGPASPAVFSIPPSRNGKPILHKQSLGSPRGSKNCRKESPLSVGRRKQLQELEIRPCIVCANFRTSLSYHYPFATSRTFTQMSHNRHFFTPTPLPLHRCVFSYDATSSKVPSLTRSGRFPWRVLLPKTKQQRIGTAILTNYRKSSRGFALYCFHGTAMRFPTLASLVSPLRNCRFPLLR